MAEGTGRYGQPFAAAKIGHASLRRFPRNRIVNIEPQATRELARLGALIGDMPLAMLTSVADDGALVSCPMDALEMDGDGALWFFIDLRSDLCERVRGLSLEFFDDVRGTRVALSGRGEIVKDVRRVDRLWSLFDSVSFPDGPDSRHLALLKVVPQKGEYWDRPNSETVRLFALGASTLSGASVGRTGHRVRRGLSSQTAGAASPR